MYSSNYIYILQKSGKKVNAIFTLKTFNAYSIEQKLHSAFSDKNIHPLRFSFNTKYKIGISGNVNRRVIEINESNFKSGHTEFFALNWLELLRAIILIYYYSIRPFLVALILTISSIFILYLYINK